MMKTSILTLLRDLGMLEGPGWTNAKQIALEAGLDRYLARVQELEAARDLWKYRSEVEHQAAVKAEAQLQALERTLPSRGEQDRDICRCGGVLWDEGFAHTPQCPAYEGKQDRGKGGTALSAHDHGNCELCDQLEREQSALLAHVQELELHLAAEEAIAKAGHAAADGAEAKVQELQREVALIREAARDMSLSDGAVRVVAAGTEPPTANDLAWAKGELEK